MANDSLILLPNKDLWRGSKCHLEASAPEQVEAAVEAEEKDPLNKAFAAVVASSRGAVLLSCLWCGQQGNEQWTRAHIAKNHKSVLDRMSDASVALHALAQVQPAVNDEGDEGSE
jgi:hypothetical protein